MTASNRPVLLLGDDAHWSDDASLELIKHVIRQRFDVPVVVVLTVRLDEIDPSHPVVALRDELAVLDRLIELAVERLPQAATIELGCDLLGTTLDPNAGDALFAESAGNPLVITEMLRAGWDGTGPVAISSRLRAVIDARFRQLSDVAAQVLDAAAVVGRPCSAALLGDVSEVEVPALVRGVDELWRRGILIESGTDAYEFSHGKLREAAYDAIPPARRRALHDTAARACIASAAADDGRGGTSLVAATWRRRTGSTRRSSGSIGLRLRHRRCSLTQRRRNSSSERSAWYRSSLPAIVTDASSSCSRRCPASSRASTGMAPRGCPQPTREP